MIATKRNQIDYHQPMHDSTHRHHLWYGGDVASITELLNTIPQRIKEIHV